MTINNYEWTDNPTIHDVSMCDTDVLNECLMHLKYENNPGDSLPLFTSMAFDHVLTGDEAIGWALQGSCITMTYPDAVNKIKSLYNDGIEWEYRGITCKKTFDGRFIADVSQKSAVDQLFGTTGVADFYILDSVNNQFYLPRNNWFAQFSADTNNVNQFNEAGLPNITGDIGRINTLENGLINGAFYFKTVSSAITLQATGQSAGSRSLDASLSSPIYGNSESVQPPSSTKLLYYKVGKTLTNESLIDVGQVLSDLQLKADKDLSNATPSQAFKDMSINWGMPDYSAGVIKPTALTGWTAESDGMVYYRTSNSQNTESASPYINGVKIGTGGYFGTVSYYSYTFFISKGDKITYDKTGSDCIFYPLKGAN